MMRIYENGTYRDATPEEIAEYEAWQKTHNPSEDPSELLSILLGGAE